MVPNGSQHRLEATGIRRICSRAPAVASKSRHHSIAETVAGDGLAAFNCTLVGRFGALSGTSITIESSRPGSSSSAWNAVPSRCSSVGAFGVWRSTR